MSESTGRLAKFEVIVHASNRNTDYGEPLTIIAATRQEAVNRAVDLGWSGRSSDARVAIRSVEDIDPRQCPCATKTTEES